MGEPMSKLQGSDAEQQQQNATDDCKRKLDGLTGLVGALQDERPFPQEQVTELVPVSPGTVRKKQRLEGERICKVCGDKAIAHNFDVITCESCKTFFRRNAHKNQKVCQYEGSCHITLTTRRFCPACRLKKCFDIGMRADMILGAEERKARMEKIRTNRLKRRESTQKCESKSQVTNSHTCPVCSPHPDPSNALLEPDAAQAVESILTDLSVLELPEGLNSVDNKQQQFHPHCEEQWPNIRQWDSVSPGEQQRVRRESSSSGGEQTQNPPVEVLNTWQWEVNPFQGVSPGMLPSDSHMYWQMTEEEQLLITKLTVAFQEEFLQTNRSISEASLLPVVNLNLEEVLSITNRSVPEIIGLLKKIPDFRALDINDQQAVIKANALLSMVMVSALSYSEELEAWIKDVGVLSLEMFCRVLKDDVVMRHLGTFSRTLKRLLKDDHSAYVLLLCCIFFDPAIPNLCDRQTVNFLLDKYTMLLKHYLDSQFSYQFSALYHDALRNILRKGRAISREITVLFSQWKDMMQPLMIEALNFT